MHLVRFTRRWTYLSRNGVIKSLWKSAVSFLEVHLLGNNLLFPISVLRRTNDWKTRSIEYHINMVLTSPNFCTCIFGDNVTHSMAFAVAQDSHHQDIILGLNHFNSSPSLLYRCSVLFHGQKQFPSCRVLLKHHKCHQFKTLWSIIDCF